MWHFTKVRKALVIRVCSLKGPPDCTAWAIDIKEVYYEWSENIFGSAYIDSEQQSISCCYKCDYSK